MGPSVVISGGSRGIGAAMVSLFAQAGYAVTFSYLRHGEQAQALVSELVGLGHQVQAYQADVRLAADAQALVAKAEAAYGAPAVLINNAGISAQALFTDISEAEWDDMFAVHVKGAFHLSQAVLPGMIRAKYGRIINIASMWGLSGASCEVHYAAAKGALIAMTKALAKELGPSGITVNAIAPGVIATAMNAAYDQETLDDLASACPLGCIGRPDDVARLALYLTEAGGDFITGQVIQVDGGFIG